jgi:hypothetical protein
MVYELASASVAKPKPVPGMGPLALCSVDITAPPRFLDVTVWVHVSLSAPSEYTMVTWSPGSMATAGPLIWPLLVNTDASTHHCPELAPHQALLVQSSAVVWIRSPVLLDMPGHRNSGPTPEANCGN